MHSLQRLLLLQRLNREASDRLLGVPGLKVAGAMSLQPSASSPPASRDACKFHLREELPMGKDPRQVIAGFRAAVNMSAEEVDAWLGSPESRRAVEQGREAADREGRHAARRIVELLRKDDGLFYEADLEHMWQISQYIACHRSSLAPGAEVPPLERYHLMNFGFDPLKVGAGGAGAGEDAEKRQRLV